MADKNSLTEQRLRAMLRYDPTTGLFTWICRPNKRIQIGTVAGYLDHDYVLIGLDGETYAAHRLAWFYVYGQWPSDEIDHEDLCKSNNRWLNLRSATRMQNAQNRPALSQTNTSGLRGVNFHPRIGKWRAFIGHAGKKIHLGYFDDKDSAALERALAEVHYFTHSALASGSPQPRPR